MQKVICLRCGYCCLTSWVVIVDDPDIGISPDNLLAVNLLKDGPCKHLVGDTPGEYSCAIHDKEWYRKTPCFAHGQIEDSPDSECRMGRYILDKRARQMEAQETNQDSTSKYLCFGSGFELWNSDTAFGRALREQFPGAVTSLTLFIPVNEPPTITVTYDNLDVMLCDDVPDIIKTFVPKEQPPELDNKEETE